MAASLLVLEIYKNVSFLLSVIEHPNWSVQFGCTASQWKEKKAEDLQAYWVILTERVQVTYLKVKRRK